MVWPMATTVNSSAAVAAAGLHKSFGAVRAVDGIDLRIEPGEIVALLGPNGAGKTTTIDMILGLSHPDRGSVPRCRRSLVASTAGGAMVAVERALGWTRQLRLTPLRPLAYMAIKVLSAMVLGLMSVVVVFVVGALSGVTVSVIVNIVGWTAAFIAGAALLFRRDTQRV
jgi:energy-coupling factor transporter ATP-binding protein EcfA2